MKLEAIYPFKFSTTSFYLTAVMNAKFGFKVVVNYQTNKQTNKTYTFSHRHTHVNIHTAPK